MPYKDKEKAREYNRQYKASHKEQASQLGRKRYSEYKNKHLCPKCGQPVLEGRALCLLHLDYYKRIARKRNQKAEICEYNRLYQREKRLKRQSENKCVDCGMPLNVESRMGVRCLTCYTKNRFGG